LNRAERFWVVDTILKIINDEFDFEDFKDSGVNNAGLSASLEDQIDKLKVVAPSL
jgi:hypothetical protein